MNWIKSRFKNIFDIKNLYMLLGFFFFRLVILFLGKSVFILGLKSLLLYLSIFLIEVILSWDKWIIILNVSLELNFVL